MTTGERTTEVGPDGVATDRMTADIGLLVADMEQLLKATAGQAGQHMTQVRAKTEPSLRAAKARLAELQDVALETSCAAGRATDEYVRANPWQFVGMGAVAGLVLGWAVARSAGSRPRTH